jgi:hypothetical protein
VQINQGATYLDSLELVHCCMPECWVLLLIVDSSGPQAVLLGIEVADAALDEAPVDKTTRRNRSYSAEDADGRLIEFGESGHQQFGLRGPHGQPICTGPFRSHVGLKLPAHPS